jgi:hypothetical protein
MDPAVSTQSDTTKLIVEPLKLEWIAEEPFSVKCLSSWMQR